MTAHAGSSVQQGMQPAVLDNNQGINPVSDILHTSYFVNSGL